MKVKMKLDVAQIKQWLFEHGEKVALSLMVIVFLLFTYKALTRETLDASKEPDKLISMANEVTNHVANSKWTAEGGKLAVIDYQQRAERKPVDAKAYALSQALNPPLADAKSKREMPEFFKLEELRTAAGVGTFALLPEGAAAAVANAGARAPAVAANGPAPLIQGGMQQAARRAAAAGGGGADAARAAGGAPRVAEDKGRRGVRPSTTSRLKAQPWAVVTALIPIDKQIKEYARVFHQAQGGDPGRDIPRYLVRLERVEVTDQKPDNADWQKIKKGSAFETEWESQATEVIPAANVDPGATGHLGPLVGGVWGESVAHPKVPLASAAAKEHEAAIAAQAIKVEEKVAEKPANDDDAFNFAQPAANKVDVANPQQRYVATGPAPPQYRLMRAFDYTVEPTKRYRYRVVMAIANPNYGVHSRFLKNAEDAQKQYFELVSEPTDVVTVPGGYGLLAGLVTPLPRVDPSAKVLFTKIDAGTGIEAPYEAAVQRGSVGNFTGVDVTAFDPRTNQPFEIKDTDFRTGMVVIDMNGGRNLSLKKREKPLLSPGEVLLVEPSGKLVVHREMDDEALYHDFKPPEPPKERETPRKSDGKKSDGKKGDPVGGADPKKAKGGGGMGGAASKILKGNK